MAATLRRVDSQLSDSGASDDTLVGSAAVFERQLGDTETSYFLPSRDAGVNDMYLHLGFNAPPALMDRDRVAQVWAILRMRHPLLASKVQMVNYDDIKFVYSPPQTPQSALDSANASLEYRRQGKDELIDEYLNGPRTLSNERLSYLILAQEKATQADNNFDLLICATHFLGDGMALHQFANDFFSLLADQRDLDVILTDEWEKRCALGKNKDETYGNLPSSLESRLPAQQGGKLAQIARRIEFEKSQAKLIGGQSFPRGSGQERRTVVPTVSFPSDKTKTILQKCKTNGVSISAALFSICNYAWARTTSGGWELPMMMYSALNLRPLLTASATANDTYWFLAIGYFNVVLPTFLPRAQDQEKIFWHRARSAKNQSTYAAKNPMLVARSLEMARERGQRARAWGKEDDERALGIWKPAPAKPVEKSATEKAPCTCLIGLSLLGNLDGIYKHANVPSIKLHTLTTGSRQRRGGILLFGYTFAGKLWISLGYDENGFDETVPRFWQNMLNAVDTFLA
ncbi:putative 15-O-acetyltransferase Tri3 [Mycena kentingensis (nom. inval.)]|nr:putative 15-O-acetyltransferase Tri3 [Mycena kentingensis (nom. inval.)]